MRFLWNYSWAFCGGLVLVSACFQFASGDYDQGYTLVVMALMAFIIQAHEMTIRRNQEAMNVNLEPFMDSMSFQFRRFRIDFDRDYGADHKTGWSVAYDGSYIVQFSPSLSSALKIALKKCKEMEEEA